MCRTFLCFIYFSVIIYCNNQEIDPLLYFRTRRSTDDLTNGNDIISMYQKDLNFLKALSSDEKYYYSELQYMNLKVIVKTDKNINMAYLLYQNTKNAIQIATKFIEDEKKNKKNVLSEFSFYQRFILRKIIYEVDPEIAYDDNVMNEIGDYWIDLELERAKNENDKIDLPNVTVIKIWYYLKDDENKSLYDNILMYPCVDEVAILCFNHLFDGGVTTEIDLYEIVEDYFKNGKQPQSLQKKYNDAFLSTLYI